MHQARAFRELHALGGPPSAGGRRHRRHSQARPNVVVGVVVVGDGDEVRCSTTATRSADRRWQRHSR